MITPSRSAAKVASPTKPETKKNISRLVALLGVMAGLSAIAIPINLYYAGNAKVRPHLQKGVQLYQAGKVEEAIASWRTALQNDPNHPVAYRLLSEALLQQGMAEEAVPLLKQLEKLNPKEEHLYCRLAEAAALTVSGETALNASKEAVSKEPDCGRAHALYGIQMGERQDHAVAVSELSRALVLEPGNTRIALSLAQAQLNAADLDGVEKTIRQVLVAKPGEAKAHYLLGWAYARRTPTPENLKQATDSFLKAYQLNPGLSDVPAELGRLRILAGDSAGAKTYLEKAWTVGPQTEDVAFNLAKVYRSLGDTVNAATMNAEFKRLADRKTRTESLQKRLSTNQNDIDAAIELAELSVEAKNWEEASALLQPLQSMRPDDVRVLTASVKLYQGIGDTESAKAFEQRLVLQQAQQKEDATRKAK
jgi:Flp pilus assembly protein TadD